MADNFNNFFGIDDDNDESMDEPINSNQRNYYNSNNTDKSWISFTLVVILLTIVALGIATGSIAVGKSGIKMHGDKFYTEYTYSQLQVTEFKVDNKNARDVSKNTVWTLNNQPLNSGTNSVYLDMELMQWGDNLLTATNGEDVVTYVINLRKFQSDIDEIHNLLSMMVDYPSDFYNYGIQYNECDQYQIDEIARYVYRATVHEDNSVTTVQKYNDIKLEVKEDLAYSLQIEKCSELSSAYTGEQAVAIHGDWGYVHSAKLIFPIDRNYKDAFQVIHYSSNGLEVLDKNTYTYYNGNMIVPINGDGEYFAKIAYNVDFSKPNAYYNLMYFEISEDMPILYNEVSHINEDGSEREYFPSVIDGDTTGFSNSYTDKINKIAEDAKLKANVSLDINKTIFNGNKLLVIGSEGEVRNYNIEECSFTQAMWLAINRDIENQYLRNTVLLIDFSSASFSQIQSIMMSVKELGEFFDTSNIHIIAIGNTTKNMKSLVEMPSNVKMYEIDELDRVDNMIDIINSDIEAGKVDTIKLRSGEEAEVYIAADCGFDIMTDGINTKCTFNEELQGSNSFGQNLVCKLVYLNRLKESLVTGNIRDFNESDYDGYLDLRLNEALTHCGLYKSNIDEIYKNGINSGSSYLVNTIHNLTMVQLNTIDNSLIDLTYFNRDNPNDKAIVQLIDKIKSGEPVMAFIENSFGSTSILINRIDRDVGNVNKFYIHFYDPNNPTEDNIATLTYFRGISDTNNIGFGYDFDYTRDIEYTNLAVMGSIEFESEEDYYIESYQD